MRRVVLVLAGLGCLLAGCTSSQQPTGAPTTPSATPTTTSTPLATPTSTAASPTPHTSTTKPRTSPPRRTTTPPPPAPASTQNPAPTVSFPPGSGPVIALNPGHNGQNGSHPAEINRLVPADRYGDTKACDTTGTNTNGGYPEHAFNWDVTLRVRTILQAHGVRVILTRPDDNGVGPCVDARAATGNQKGVAAVVSIHADGAPDGAHGYHVCYDSRPPAGPQIDARSRALSRAVHDALSRGSGLVPAAYIGTHDGYFARSDLAALNLATVPATFLELGNMRNAGDAALLTSTAGRQRIAAAVAAGILAYLGR